MILAFAETENEARLSLIARARPVGARQLLGRSARAAGAKIEARNGAGLTPLAAAFSFPSRMSPATVAAMLEAGAKLTSKARRLARECAESSDSGNELRAALERHGVSIGKAPRAPVTPLRVAKHDALWKKLVPKSGKAASLQGEVIRISGRLSREMIDNGSMNWDADWEAMLAFFVDTLRSDVTFTRTEQALIKILARGRVKKGRRFIYESECDRLEEFAVRWTLAHEAPLKLPRVAYKH